MGRVGAIQCLDMFGCLTNDLPRGCGKENVLLLIENKAPSWVSLGGLEVAASADSGLSLGINVVHNILDLSRNKVLASKAVQIFNLNVASVEGCAFLYLAFGAFVF